MSALTRTRQRLAPGLPRPGQDPLAPLGHDRPCQVWHPRGGLGGATRGGFQVRCHATHRGTPTWHQGWHPNQQACGTWPWQARDTHAGARAGARPPAPELARVQAPAYVRTRYACPYAQDHLARARASHAQPYARVRACTHAQRAHTPAPIRPHTSRGTDTRRNATTARVADPARRSPERLMASDAHRGAEILTEPQTAYIPTSCVTPGARRLCEVEAVAEVLTAGFPECVNRRTPGLPAPTKIINACGAPTRAGSPPHRFRRLQASAPARDVTARVMTRHRRDPA
jgi:hypothetical protein